MGQTVCLVTGSETPCLLHIGAVAERTERSLRTLRHDDEIGLVVPTTIIAKGNRATKAIGK